MGLETTRYASGRLADLVSQNETDGYFACGLMAGLQRSGPTLEPLRAGMLWLDEHPNCNTPETTRSGSFGGMPVGVATGCALQRMPLDAKLDPPPSDRQVAMGGAADESVRTTVAR